MAKDKVLVSVVESPKRKIENPEYILQMDRIVMKDGLNFVVTECNQEELTLMPMGGMKLKKEDLATFLKDIQYILRADCFER